MGIQWKALPRLVQEAICTWAAYWQLMAVLPVDQRCDAIQRVKALEWPNGSLSRREAYEQVYSELTGGNT